MWCNKDRIFYILWCFAELISCKGTSGHHHPHRHFPLRLESFSRDAWEMQGRLWQRHFSLQHNLFQTIFALPLPVASCFCWQCLLEKKKRSLSFAWALWLQVHPVLKRPVLRWPQILLELLWEQFGKAPSFYDSVPQLTVSLNRPLRQILSKVPPVIKWLIYIHF